MNLVGSRFYNTTSCVLTVRVFALAQSSEHFRNIFLSVMEIEVKV